MLEGKIYRVIVLDHVKIGWLFGVLRSIGNMAVIECISFN